jgi:hypothetical protein
VLVIFDTGAPGLILNSRHYASDKGPNIQCTGINGDFECATLEVKEWIWMDMSHKRTNALLSDLSFLEQALGKEVHALIGLSVLNDYYISIDFDQMTISLSEKWKANKNEMIRFQYVEHLPVIACKVNGERKILGIDSGSEINYLFSFDETDYQNLNADPSAVVVVGTGNRTDVKHKVPMDLELSDHNLYPSDFIVDLFGQGSFKPKAFDGLLGQSFLSKFNVTINPSKQIIILSPRKTIENPSATLTAQL